MGNLIEPRPQSDVAPERARFLHEDQECRLEGVFGVARIFQDSPADVQHEGSVPRNQGLERLAVACGDKTVEELRI